MIDVGGERFKACELLFNPSLLEAERCSIFGVKAPEELRGVHDLISEAVGKCDADIKKELFQNVILTGGLRVFCRDVDSYGCARVQRSMGVQQGVGISKIFHGM